MPTSQSRNQRQISTLTSHARLMMLDITTKRSYTGGMTKQYVAYYRVSTQRQGVSGLGLDAQRAAVLGFINGGAEVLAEFSEVESGKRDDRPQLAAALARCREAGATLAIAKLDRLARNVAFIANLMESKVEFVAVDMPMASRLTLHILAAVAEHEREMISARTKAAMAQAKARGVRIGLAAAGRDPRAPSLAAGVNRRARAVAFALTVRPTLERIRAAGAATLAAMAGALNAEHISTAGGCCWTAAAVRRVLLLIAQPPEPPS